MFGIYSTWLKHIICLLAKSCCTKRDAWAGALSCKSHKFPLLINRASHATFFSKAGAKHLCHMRKSQLVVMNYAELFYPFRVAHGRHDLSVDSLSTWNHENHSSTHERLVVSALYAHFTIRYVWSPFFLIWNKILHSFVFFIWYSFFMIVTHTYFLRKLKLLSWNFTVTNATIWYAFMKVINK